MSRDLTLFLEDIEKSCAKIVLFTEGKGRDEVFADEMRLDAILRNFQIVGEAVKNLPADWRQRHSEIPWRTVAGLRDVVAHAYFALDLDIIWNVIQEEVPKLLLRIRSILAEETR